MSVQIIKGDARSTGLADRSVHMIATSPPYWGLRSYLKKDDPAKASEIGAETTPEAYIGSMRAVGRECYRVLHDDGVMWLNLGDTYASGGGLVGIPWRVAFALQADGWILRAAIPWVKANCMPESVKNRPTVAHEYVLLFVKHAGYFYDADAVREPVSQTPGAQAWRRIFDPLKQSKELVMKDQGVKGGNNGQRDPNQTGRNLRTSDFMNVALDEYEAHIKRVRGEGGLLLSPEGDPLTFLVNPVPNSLGHFAMWPPKLVAPMILAGTSERGCCPTCGAQWLRRKNVVKSWREQACATQQAYGPGSGNRRARSSNGGMSQSEYSDAGFFPACSCPAHEPIPSTVFDPFGGTGTTAQVARALGRSTVLCELNEAYHPLIAKRLEERLNPEDWRPVKREARPARKVRERRADPMATVETTHPARAKRQRELFA